MELIDFLKTFAAESEIEAFAVRCGTTLGHLRNCAYRGRFPSAALAAQIDIESGGLVPRSTLRPKDWHLIWDPRLAQQMVEDRAILAHGQPTASKVEAAHVG